MSKPLNAEALFDDIHGFVSQSAALLQKGEFVDLSGLDAQVAQLCEAVLQLTQEQRITHAARMQQVLGELQALGNAMTAIRDSMSEEIRGLSHHKKASVAYRSADTVDKDKKE